MKTSKFLVSFSVFLVATIASLAIYQSMILPSIKNKDLADCTPTKFRQEEKDGIFYLLWNTKSDCTGYVRYGSNQNSFPYLALDEQGVTAIKNHSVKLNGISKGDKFYFVIVSNEKNIKLVQIFEDELLLKQDITLSRLSGLLNLNKKISARKCEIKEINKNESKIFLDANHIQGNSIDKFRYGLFFNGELVSIMTFGSKRKSLGFKNKNNNEYELTRFCNKINTNVIGGFSKLLSFFCKKYNPEKIITYADIRWSGINHEKTVYYKNNFTFLETTPPNYWYIDTKHFLVRYHRFSFRKDLLVKQGYDSNKTEWEIMKERKFDRIWDCGTMKFELNLNEKTPN